MIDPQDSVLIIVDVQGKLAQLMNNKDQLFDNLSRVVSGFMALDIPIIWMEQLPDKLGATIPEIANQLPHMQALSKSSFGCMGSEAFCSQLELLNRKQVALVGIETHICVYQTAAQLLKAGYEVSIVEDATSSRSAANYQTGLRRMHQLGAISTSVEMLLFELMGDAKHASFRDVAKLVK